MRIAGLASYFLLAPIPNYILFGDGEKCARTTYHPGSIHKGQYIRVNVRRLLSTNVNISVKYIESSCSEWVLPITPSSDHKHWSNRSHARDHMHLGLNQSYWRSPTHNATTSINPLMHTQCTNFHGLALKTKEILLFHMLHGLVTVKSHPMASQATVNRASLSQEPPIANTTA